MTVKIGGRDRHLKAKRESRKKSLELGDTRTSGEAPMRWMSNAGLSRKRKKKKKKVERNWGPHRGQLKFRKIGGDDGEKFY